MKEFVKIVVTVPVADADNLRKAIGEAGGGVQGNYDFTSFSTKGIGRFRPIEGANPAIGKVGKLEEVEEERIEFLCEKEKASKVVSEIRKAHPYEEPAIDTYPLFTP